MEFSASASGIVSTTADATNVMPDLAMAMKYNPDLKVLLNAGYFDLATPFYEGVYEMQHLPIPAKLQKNIEFQFYESGHMVYAHAASLKAARQCGSLHPQGGGSQNQLRHGDLKFLDGWVFRRKARSGFSCVGFRVKFYRFDDRSIDAPAANHVFASAGFHLENHEASLVFH